VLSNTNLGINQVKKFLTQGDYIPLIDYMYFYLYFYLYFCLYIYDKIGI
jgi:hypothetical protein